MLNKFGYRARTAHGNRGEIDAHHFPFFTHLHFL